MNGFEQLFYMIGILATLLFTIKMLRQILDGSFYTIRKIVTLLSCAIFFKKKPLDKKDDIRKNKQMPPNTKV